MSQTAQIVASGPGWQAVDVVCRAAAHDRPFEEAHSTQCIALVTRGTFRYRSREGTAVMTPGALLLGNDGACFECGHEHSRGDRCISFHFSPERWENLARELQADGDRFTSPKLLPMPALAGLYADAENACETRSEPALEEVALRLAAAALLSGDRNALPAIKPRDHKRVADAVRLIEDEAERPISLDELAGTTATSPYHFLRVFRDGTGMTPYQFVLKTRLHRAAVRLRTSTEAVSTIAVDCGFNDLSTFNRRFLNVMGVSPTTYRARHRGSNPARTSVD